ncbi:uncharacterized protein LOC119993243 [Tripterygium wilfordii]|uniref:uncharacterized protein LOC119993243 n=1 Tax=Tripterygium wilfordii TaxID=458696 RepID=UPI0018F805CA|nr:uncharacterized protein LOC119993243 [Tripterygium wilfordii]
MHGEKPEKRTNVHYVVAKANMVEHDHKDCNRKQIGKVSSQGSNAGGAGGNKKFNRTCLVCNKLEYRAIDCCHLQKKNAHANVVENVDEEAIELTSVVSKVNMVYNPKEWWVDIGVTCRVFSDMKSYSEFEATDDENSCS